MQDKIRKCKKRGKVYYRSRQSPVTSRQKQPSLKTKRLKKHRMKGSLPVIHIITNLLRLKKEFNKFHIPAFFIDRGLDYFFRIILKFCFSHG